MELDFDKYCVVDGSPKTVLPAPRSRSKVAYRKSNGKVKCGNDMLSFDKDFTEIRFDHYRSASCRDARSRRTNQEVLKRGSVYQSSKEVTLLRRSDDVGREKIEFARGSASTISFGIIDSLCSSDEDGSLAERNRSSVMSISEQSTSSFCKNQEELHSRDSIIFSSNPILSRIASQDVSSSRKSKKVFADNQSVQDFMITAGSAVAQINDTNSSQERDSSVDLRKSLSAKLALPHSPAYSESDSLRTNSPKTRFHPVRKMFDPFVKSKSHKSPLNCAYEGGSTPISGHASMSCNETIGKSPSNDLSDKPHHVRDNSQCGKKENNNDSVSSSSPMHLHGLLKMERKQGVPVFEFSVKSPEDVYVAKACKVDNALTWAYTFHSLHHKRKSNASGWGFKENKESSMVGKMIVSCYLCTELKGAGAFNDSMVTEFVSYDVSHSRRSISSQDNSSCSPDVSKVHSTDSGHFESSASQPQAAVELHPGQEIAAIVIQVPFQNRVSLKFKSEDTKMEKPLSNLLNLCRIEEETESNPGKMHVVIPAGNHSLPSTESRGPSPLLDRWRLGGGCDCGGWDMACPLNVCGNPNFQIAEGQPLIDSQHPAELFVQGRKDNAPAFSMREIDDRKYAVDFHAQLSTLQAFSISVAILHAAEASSAAGRERSKQMLQSDSMRVFAEEEIKCLIDAIAEEEKNKETNKMEEVLPSFVINPPFSPIARV